MTPCFLWISLFWLIASPCLAAEGMQTSSLAVTVGGKELLISEGHRELDGEAFLPGEAEEIEKFLTESGTTLTVFDVEEEPLVDVAALATDDRKPASDDIKGWLKHWNARGLIEWVRIPKQVIEKSYQGSQDFWRFILQWPGILGKEIKGEFANQVKPENRANTARTWAWGTIHTVVQTTAKSSAWLAVPAVSPAVALQAGMVHGALTALGTLFPAAFNRSFGKQLDPEMRYVSFPGGEKKENPVSLSVHSMRRRLWNYAIYTILNSAVALSAGLGLPAILATIPPLVIAVEGRALIAPEMHKRFFEKVHDPTTGEMEFTPALKLAGERFGNLLYCVALPIALMDMAGLGTVLLNVGMYSIRTYTVATLGVYLGFWLAIKKFPDTLTGLLLLKKELIKAGFKSDLDRLKVEKAAARERRAKRRTERKNAKEPTLKPRAP